MTETQMKIQEAKARFLRDKEARFQTINTSSEPLDYSANVYIDTDENPEEEYKGVERRITGSYIKETQVRRRSPRMENRYRNSQEEHNKKTE